MGMPRPKLRLLGVLLCCCAAAAELTIRRDTDENESESDR